MSEQGCEIDFLAVGDGSKSGDAIALRFGNLQDPRPEQFVMVIDGGSKENGEQLVRHIKQFYNTDNVNAVFLTHPDADHASGLTEVLKNLTVQNLVMHLPWEHSYELRGLFRDGRVTPNSLKETLEKSLNNAYELHQIAEDKGINILEPFSDTPNIHENLTVLSPSKDIYTEMVANFRDTPQPREAFTLAGLAGQGLGAVKDAVNMIFENWGWETLSDPDYNATSAENNTSVILLLSCCDKKYLFTGDAGVLALEQASEKAWELGIDLKNVGFIQIPHHGSKRNVGPTVLNQIVGPILGEDTMEKTAFVSAAKEGAPKHPAKKVTNAFRRRGCKVFSTVGQSICHFENVPFRSGYSAIESLPVYESVEE